MESVKHKLQKRIESNSGIGREILEMGHKRIQVRDDRLSSIVAPIEATDDDDLAVAKVVEANKNTDLDSIVPDEMPLYVSGPGFDDCLSPEEIEYIHKKHPNIVLTNDLSDFGEQNAFNSLESLRESVDDNQATLQAIFDEGEKETDAMQNNVEQILERLENIF